FLHYFIKNRGRKMKKIWASLAVLLLIIGVLAACSGGSQSSGQQESSGGSGSSGEKENTGGSDSGGEAKGTVKIGGIFDLTGGTGDVGTPYAEGAEAFF